MKTPKQKPVYTRARHEVYEPQYVQKKLQLHKKIVFSQHDARETWYSAYASVVQFIANSETNCHLPCAYFNLTLGNYNKFQIHTRDFIAVAQSLTELANWANEHAEQIQNTLNAQMDKYNQHQFNKFILTNELPPEPYNPTSQP